MNKRMLKKREMQKLCKIIYLIKIPINQNDRYNPIVKCRGIRKLTKEMRRLYRQHPQMDSLLVAMKGNDAYD